MRAQDGTLIIMGASITGMLAAKSLAPFFRQVTVLERDPAPQGPENRKGIPQGRHSHVLLVKGRWIFERTFPGLMDDLVARGAVPFDYAQDGVLRLGGRRLPRFASGVVTISCTRALLEWRVARHLDGVRNVSVRYGTAVKGFRLDPEAGRITGVYAAGAVDSGSDPEFLPADLVVDAGGRTSRTPAWLAEAGLPGPRETVVDPKVGYSSRLYAWPESFSPGWKVVGMAANFPHDKKGGALLKVEGGRMLATLVGLAGEYPPADDAGFERFAKSLPDPLIHETLAGLSPLTPVTAFRNTANRIRHYEDMPGFPGGLIVLGDAACALNPIYAQGLTLAAVGAETLARSVRKHPPGAPFTARFCRRFQKALARGNRTAWMMAVGEDARWPQTEGARPGLFNRIIYAYMGRLIRTMASEPRVTRRFLRVMHLVSGPLALFHPVILLSILRDGIGKGKSPAANPAKSGSNVPAGTPAIQESRS